MDYQYYYIPSAATYTVSSKDIGVLHTVVIGTAPSGTITISDNSGTIAILPANVTGTFIFDVCYVGFLKVVTAGTGTLTVCYR